MISTNSQGNKFSSLVSLVERNAVSVFMVQETHARKKGKHVMSEYVIFEAIRKRKGGGTMMGLHKNMNPVLISSYEDEFELLVVEATVNKSQITFITGYGPQESWTGEERIPFFIALDTEISKAISDGKSVYVAMDANAKLGKEFIPNDPHEMSKNGEIMAEIIERNGMCVANGETEKCEGVITRQRSTESGRIEKSAIDLVIISSDLNNALESIKIDEERKHVLSKVVKNKNGETKVTESDYNIIQVSLDIKVNKTNVKEKCEIYNIKNQEGQIKFTKYTNKTNMSKLFEDEQDLEVATGKFIKQVNGAIKACFKKVRIDNKRKGKLQQLYDKRAKLKEEEKCEELKEVEEEIADETCKTIQKEIKELNCEDGGYNPGGLWKLKHKVIPKPTQVPTGMKDKCGKLLTKKEDLQNHTMKHYENVLRNRPIKEGLSKHKRAREELCKLRLKQTKENKTPDWSKTQLKVVLKELKKDKSRDPNSWANELFDPKVAGEDLIDATLALMNRIKREQIYPKSMELCNISSLYKQKGPINEFGSYRGVFRVQVLRNILEKLIYNDEYKEIDSNLTDCNVGARKNRNIRDNIFVLDAIMNDTVNGSKEPIDIAIYDIEKCFDALWVEECINDMYDTGLKNDKLNLLFLMNQNAQIAIKTPNGMTQRKSITNIIMQGTVWGSLFCTATMDKLGKLKYSDETMLYKYKGKVGVPALEMVDDIADVQKCGTNAVKSNAVVNAFVEHKKLTLSGTKCSKIHCGKATRLCPDLKVHKETMHASEEERYLGDQITKNAKHAQTVSKRRAKAYGIISDIMQILDTIGDRTRKIKVGLQLRQAWFINALLVNIEVWHNVLSKDIEVFTQLDNYLMRKILKAHSKIPIEMLYLETGTIPVEFVIMSRRVNYLHNVIRRDSTELVARVYNVQKQQPSKGDWCSMVKENMELIKLNMSESEIKETGQAKFKSIVKKLVKIAAFQTLHEKKLKHSKIKQIEHKEFKMQKYFESEALTAEQASTLLNLRGQSINGIKMCFPSSFQNDKMCKLGCQTEDNIEHVFECEKITSGRKVNYSAVFASFDQQKEAVTTFITRMATRTRILEADHTSTPAGCAGGITGQLLFPNPLCE